MNRNRRTFWVALLIASFLFLSSFVIDSEAGQLWFSPNTNPNFNRDFINLFEPTSNWSPSGATVLKLANMYFYPGGGGLESGVREKIISKINSMNLSLAIESSSVTDWGCLSTGTNPNGTNPFAVTSTAIDNIVIKGGSVKYISMDEPLHYGMKSCKACSGDRTRPCSTDTDCLPSYGTCSSTYSIDGVAEQTKLYINALKGVYPALTIGDIEPYPHFKKTDLITWVDTLKNKGITLAFLHIDADWDHMVAESNKTNGPTVQAQLKELADLQTEIETVRGIPFGVIAWHADYKLPLVSDEMFYKSTMTRAAIIHNTLTKNPAHYIVQSWSAFPRYSLPQTSNYTLTRLLKDYSENFFNKPKPSTTAYNTEGYVDGMNVDSGLLGGWSLDKDVSGGFSSWLPVAVEFYLDYPWSVTGTKLINDIFHSDPRPDVNTAKQYPGDHGFSYQPRIQDNNQHSLYVYAIDPVDKTKVLLPPSPISIRNSQPTGSHDGFFLNKGIAWGWAYDSDAQLQPLAVHFYADGAAGSGGKWIGSTTANLHRQDLIDKQICRGDHGFEFRIPCEYLDGQQHSLYAYAIDTWQGPNPNLPPYTPLTNGSFNISRIAFDDVPAGYWAESFIKGVYCRGIADACQSTPFQSTPFNFCLGTITTRASASQYIIKAMGETPFSPYSAPSDAYFDDLSGYESVAGYINKMKELGITTGCAYRAYCPSSSMTRAQMAVFMITAKIVKDSTEHVSGAAYNAYFSDIADDGFVPYINRMYELGITGGCAPDNPATPANERRYCPNDYVPKDQMAVFLTTAFPQ